MPVYEQQCTQCGHVMEELVKDKSELSNQCAACGSAELQQCFTAFGHYSIKGNNSASVTPKKYRGGK